MRQQTAVGSPSREPFGWGIVNLEYVLSKMWLGECGRREILSWVRRGGESGAWGAAAQDKEAEVEHRGKVRRALQSRGSRSVDEHRVSHHHSDHDDQWR